VASIEFRNVTKRFDKTTVIENMNLTLEDGKFTVLVGPSGCGKTTLLRMIAGIGPQTEGQVLIDGLDVSNVAPGLRNVSMVFQNYAIYPTMNVMDNITFGLKNNGVKKADREKAAREVAEIVGLSDYLDRMPGALSGGQRQRVALARAMVKKPAVFLMDEPLSNLDAKLRVSMRVELIELHQRLKTTFVYVTHDQVEAMSMADEIVLMNYGLIQQKSSPEVIYNDPNNIFTAQFIGSPAMNILPLGVDGVKFGFRPEKFKLMSAEDAFFKADSRIITREMLGSETIYKVGFGDNAVMCKSMDSSADVGDTMVAGVAKEDLYIFDANEMRIREDNPAYEKYLEMLRG